MNEITKIKSFSLIYYDKPNVTLAHNRMVENDINIL